MLRALLFFAISVTILAGMHYLVWARLVRDPGWPQPWYGRVTTGLIALALLLVLSFPAWRYLPRAIAVPLVWIAYGWMGLLVFLFVLVLPWSVLHLGAHIVTVTARRALVDGSRRAFLTRAAAGAIAAAAVAVAGVGLDNALRQPGLKRVRITLGRLPTALAGYRIVQLSDVHIGAELGRRFLEDVVARVNALEPHLVVITGDLVDGEVPALRHLVAPLSGLRAQDGVYFSTGNHEYYVDCDEWLGHLPTLGIRPLVNHRVAIRGDGPEGFDLVGIEDPAANGYSRGGHGVDLAGALRGRDPSRLAILLAHRPRQVHEAAAAGIDLQLSGHTHGGQFLPVHLLVRAFEPFLAGLHRVGETQVYVSRGTGFWGPPYRLAAPAELTLLELYPPDA